MIKSFNFQETERLFKRILSRKLPLLIQKTALRKLEMINAAISINDLRIPPSNHLKILKGNNQNIYSIRINDQWRICFKWNQNNAYDVEIIDYH